MKSLLGAILFPAVLLPVLGCYSTTSMRAVEVEGKRYLIEIQAQAFATDLKLERYTITESQLRKLAGMPSPPAGEAASIVSVLLVSNRLAETGELLTTIERADGLLRNLETAVRKIGGQAKAVQALENAKSAAALIGRAEDMHDSAMTKLAEAIVDDSPGKGIGFSASSRDELEQRVRLLERLREVAHGVHPADAERLLAVVGDSSSENAIRQALDLQRNDNED